MSTIKNITRYLLSTGIFLLLFHYSVQSQDHKFKMVAQVKAYPVRDQAKSGTCWSFATISFIESELIRKGKEETVLSEMFPVRYAYPVKASNYIRYHGNNTFGPGGQAHDVMNVIREYGIIPDTFFPGLNYGEKKHNHNEMDALLETMMKSMIKRDKPSLLLISNISSVLDNYLGKVPESFNYKGKTYTPKTYAKYLGIDPDDYVEITSFTHHPWYSRFVLEVPDNWSKDLYYNVPLNDMITIMDNALKNGYSVDWDGDVSEDEFSYSSGYAEVPESSASITSELRQKQFDNWSTTDDHLMHVTGLATNADGIEYYYTKNSWGTKNPYNGYLYLSTDYVKMKTIAIMVHRNAIPKDIAKKLGL